MFKSRYTSKAGKPNASKKITSKPRNTPVMDEVKTPESGTSADNPKIPKSKTLPEVAKLPKLNPSIPLKSPPEDKKFSIRRPSSLSLKSNVTPRTKDPLPVKPPLSARSGYSKAPVHRLIKSSSNISKQSIKHMSKIPQTIEQDQVKAFNIMKAKLRDSQSQFFKALSSIKDTLPEDYLFVALRKEGESKLILNGTQDMLKIDDDLKNKHLVSIKDNLDFIDSEVSSLNTEMLMQIKTLQVVSLGDSEEDVKIKQDLGNLQQKIEEISLLNVTRLSEISKSLKELGDSTASTIREIDFQDMESKLINATENSETAARKLEITEALLTEIKTREQTKDSKAKEALGKKEIQLADKEAELTKLKKALKSLEDKLAGDAELVNVRKYVKSLEDQLAEKDAELTKLKKDVKPLEDKLAGDAELANVRKDVKPLENQLAEKDAELTKLRKDVKSHEDQKHKACVELSKLKNKLKYQAAHKDEKAGKNKVSEEIIHLRSDLNHIQQQKEALEKLYEKEKEFTTKLQNEVRAKEDELSTSMSELDKIKAGGGDADNAESEFLQEIRMLKFEKYELTEERDKLEREKRTLLKDFETNSVNLQIEFNEAKEQLKSYEATNEALRIQLTIVEESLAEKTETISELESKYNGLANTSTLNQLQNELTKLQESYLEKKRQIKSLKIKLARSRHEAKQSEEEIFLYQRAQKVRAELINCIEDGEVSSECRVSDLHSEIEQQTTYINQINNELEAKAEELQTLLEAVGSKQIEMNRPENLIKLLEETKAKSQEVQNAQSKRIEQLENDFLKLKNAIRASEEASDTKNYYSSRHCRKTSGNDSEIDKNRKRKYDK